MTNIFEQATRRKVRFFYNGQISVEDVWEHSLQTLNSIYRDVNKKLKALSDEDDDFLGGEVSQTGEIILLKLQRDILRHIMTVKLEEKEQREKESVRREQNAKVLSIIARKQQQELENMPIEELQKLLVE